jgi:hypothetical protein
MRNQLDKQVEAGRLRGDHPWASDPWDGANGAFMVMGPNGVTLRIVASDGRHADAMGWEHVSVSLDGMNRCPNWPEMCFVKDLFWDEEEAVIQFHPPRSQYVNHHPTTLHLWRHRLRTAEYVLPPSILVGPK